MAWIYGSNGVKFLYNKDDLVLREANRIVASQYGEEIYGLDGNDRIQGSEGPDFISGGDGSDLIQGFGGNDILQGGMRGGESTPRMNDRIYGGDGNDEISGDGGTTDF